MALARSLPPVAIVAVIVWVLRSTTLMVESPSLTHSSAPPLTIARPFGPDALPLLVVPTKPVTRVTYLSDLVSKTTTALLSLSAR